MANDWKTRLQAEHAELANRVAKLSSYLTQGAPGASNSQREIMRRQEQAMLHYHDALLERLAQITEEETDG